MGRRVNKLFDLEFDEVSSVDRPANQHGLIAFSKSLMAETTEEGGVSDIFTETGEPVFEDELEHGDVVFDAAGNEYVFVVDDDEDDDDVEKGMLDGAMSAGKRAFSGAKGGYSLGRQGMSLTADGAGDSLKVGSRSVRAGNAVGRNPKKAAAIAAGVTGGAGVAGGGAYMIGRNKDVEKSLGDSVLEQLSKAVNEADREEIIAKALDEVEIAKAQAMAAQEELAYLQDVRVTEAFIAKAAEYNLPVSPEVFGPILKAAAEVLDDEQLEILDHVLTSAGDALFDEIGAAGGASNSIFDAVNGYASEMVTKSAGDFSLEQASTAMFSANPDAYDAYIAEQNGR